MWISSFGNPRISTLSTPEFNKLSFKSFDKRLNSERGTSPVKTILVTVSKNSPNTIFGFFEFSGKFILATAVSISVLPFCISWPYLNSILVKPTPSTDFEKTFLTPEIGRNSGSNNWVIFLSISSAVAPGHSIETPTISTSKSGKFDKTLADFQ